jgi:hypothetical protein
MARKESALRKELDLPVGLIQRSDKATRAAIRTAKKSAGAKARGRSQ